MNKKIILFSILSVGFILNIYGINWGLPHRWWVDEQVTIAVRMLAEKTFLPVDLGHPPLYFYCLALFLSPYLIFLKLINYPFDIIESAASVSWLKLAIVAPQFATNIFLISRSLSAIFGILTIYFVFLAGKRLYNEKTGLISAGILSVCMGFASVNHLAQGTSLVNFIYIVTIYFCLKSIDKKLEYTSFYIACLFGGLALTAKHNGIISILPLMTTYIMIYYRNKNLSKESSTPIIKSHLILNRYTFKSILFYAIGIFIGWPTLLTNFKGYYKFALTDNSSLFIESNNFIIPGLRISYFLRLFNYLLELIHIFGLPMSIFVFSGLIYCIFILFKRRSDVRKDKTGILLVSVLPYILIISSFPRAIFIKYATVIASMNYIILIIPVMTVIVGLTMYKFLTSFKIHKAIKYIFVISSFIFSFLYTFAGDMVFVKNDTRYKAEEWINKNITVGSTIEIFTQPALVIGPKIFPRHNIVFLGKSSFDTNNLNIYNAFKDKNETYHLLEDYFKIINTKGASSDYILIPYNTISDNYLLTGPQGDKFIYNLLNGKLNYKLIQEFSFKPRWFWNLKAGHNCPVLLLYKRE